MLTDPVVVAASAIADRSLQVNLSFWSDKDPFPSNILGHGSLDYFLGANDPSSAEGPPTKRRRQGSVVVGPAALEGIVGGGREEESDEEAEGADVTNEVKVTNTLLKAFPQMLAQVHDSMREGAGQDKEDKSLVKDVQVSARAVVNRRYAVLTSGLLYFFFLMKCQDDVAKPIVTFLGRTELRVLPTVCGRQSGTARDASNRMEQSDFRKCVAAFVLCMSDHCADV